VWVRRAAIRPVPPFAVVPEHVLAKVEDELAEDGDLAKAKLDEAFEQFEERQPALSERLGEVLSTPRDETALALGYFLGLAVWMSFERAFPEAMDEVDDVALASVDESLTLDEQIRLADPAEVVDSDDVVAMEQPHLVKFVNEHVDAALEAHADSVDVDDVHAVYRVVLVEILALSYAVRPPDNVDLASTGEFNA
jgi:hypothetical protein